MKDKGTGRSATALDFDLWRTRRACGKRPERPATGRREVQVIEGVGRIRGFQPGTETKSGLRWKTLAYRRGVSGRFWGISRSELGRFLSRAKSVQRRTPAWPMSDCSTWNTVPREFGHCARADFRTSIPGYLSPLHRNARDQTAFGLDECLGSFGTGILREEFASLHPSPNAMQPNFEPIRTAGWMKRRRSRSRNITRMFHVEHSALS